MRLAELLGCRVIDANGDDVGGVHDVRFVATTVDGVPTYRVSGLVLGGAAVGNRLGYRRDEMGGPWPLTPILRRLARRSRVVAWSDIVAIDRPYIRIARLAGDLQTAAETDDNEERNA